MQFSLGERCARQDVCPSQMPYAPRREGIQIQRVGVVKVTLVTTRRREPDIDQAARRDGTPLSSTSFAVARIRLCTGDWSRSTSSIKTFR